jgi:GAF domain-containing protein
VSDQEKPVFDEQTLARVLEAAYVLQEHNRAMELSLELQSDQLREQHAENVSAPAISQPGSDDNSAPKDDYTAVLAQIVETQHQIQLRQLDLNSTMALVAERLTQVTRANGAAVGIVEGKIVSYEAASGTSALPQGSKLPMEKALCFTCLRTGQVMRCADVHPEFLLDAEECNRRGIQSLIAVPVYHDGGVAGALELHFGKADGFNDQDVHTCQLMAGLVTEALTRDAQLTWKKSLAAERATMLEAIEKLKPNLAALAQAPAAKESVPKEAAPAPVSEHSFVCRKCGHAIVGEEQFCGKCGAPRIVDHELPSLQSKVASLWQMKASRNAPRHPANGAAGAKDPQEPLKAGEQDFSESDLRESDLNVNEEDRRERELARLLANSVPDFSVTHDPADIEQSAAHPRAGHTTGNARPSAEKLAQTEGILEEIEESVLSGAVGAETKEAEASASDAALVKADQDITWTSAAKARDFLEQVAKSHHQGAFQLFWNQRRGDVYLAVAVILMAIVIRWGIWSDHAMGATTSAATNASHRKRDADLSMFDRLLISTGLAEAPDQPEPKGNPDTQVWVDLHTALYYCPGTDLYGKTPKGRYTSQKDAQLDQFEPAYRKACD